MTYTAPTPITPATDTASQPGDREKYVNTVRENLSKIQTKMTSMKEEAGRLSGDLKRKADENITKLDGKYKEFQGRIDELKNSTDEKWQGHKDTFEKGFQDLSANYKGILS